LRRSRPRPPRPRPPRPRPPRRQAPTKRRRAPPMADFTAADVKRLRDMTGAGFVDCKNALTEADGDLERATEILRAKGAKDVDKRADRVAANGLVAISGHAIVELDCETDFVAKNAQFQ